MRNSKNRMLAAITLIGVMALAGSAQASVTVIGQVNATDADGEIVTLWLSDKDPSDYVTKVVLDAGDDVHIDYYWFDEIDPLLDRHGYTYGDTNIPVTIAIFRSGTERNINGIPGNSYTNKYRNVTVVHGTVPYTAIGGTYNMPVMEIEECEIEETFSKTLYAGWNLISLPLVPSDNSASTVLSTVSYDAVYSYNATSKQFESADVMDPGTGYFVNATADCTWNYSGDEAYTSIDVSLKKGLNMAGWLNCSKDVGDALSSISGDYHYVARWNTSAEKFEVYNPTAPDLSEFNDFTTMDRGTGYFISAKQDCALSESC